MSSDNDVFFAQFSALTYLPQPCVASLLKTCSWLQDYILGYEIKQQTQEQTLLFNRECFKHQKCQSKKCWKFDLTCRLDLTPTSTPSTPSTPTTSTTSITSTPSITSTTSTPSITSTTSTPSITSTTSDTSVTKHTTYLQNIFGFEEVNYGVKCLIFYKIQKAPQTKIKTDASQTNLHQKQTRRLVISFRPSYNHMNWEENFWALPSCIERTWFLMRAPYKSRIHPGFEESMQNSRVLPWIKKILGRIVSEAQCNLEVYLVGMSLGGSLAFLSGHHVKDILNSQTNAASKIILYQKKQGFLHQLKIKKNSLPKQPHTLACITFGAPKVGNIVLNHYLLKAFSYRHMYQGTNDHLACLPFYPPFTHKMAHTVKFTHAPLPSKKWDWTTEIQEYKVFKHACRRSLNHCCYCATWLVNVHPKHWPKQIVQSNKLFAPDFVIRLKEEELKFKQDQRHNKHKKHKKKKKRKKTTHPRLKKNNHF